MSMYQANYSLWNRVNEGRRFLDIEVPNEKLKTQILLIIKVNKIMLFLNYRLNFVFINAKI